VLLESVWVEGCHVGYEADDGFPDYHFFGFPILQGRITYWLEEVLHGLTSDDIGGIGMTNSRDADFGASLQMPTLIRG
jgi:hypothetical protein